MERGLEKELVIARKDVTSQTCCILCQAYRARSQTSTGDQPCENHALAAQFSACALRVLRDIGEQMDVTYVSAVITIHGGVYVRLDFTR